MLSEFWRTLSDDVKKVEAYLQETKREIRDYEDDPVSSSLANNYSWLIPALFSVGSPHCSGHLLEERKRHLLWPFSSSASILKGHFKRQEAIN